MPTINAVPGLPAPVTVIVCAECCTNHFTVGEDGRFHCPCGSVITPRDLVLEPDDAWCITPAGLLAYVTAPVVALRRYWEARAVMDDKGVWGPELKAAHAEYRAALAELDAARGMGIPLPHDTPVEIGRVYLACSLNANGTIAGSNAYALGWDCEPCAPRATDPCNQELHPCRNPRAHAWSVVNDWNRLPGRRKPQPADVFSPFAPDLPTARAKADEMWARIVARTA
ncbi:hypothetical protein [Streptomyces bottropensis]|uniref:hypothetical protein n=1 Tax=Streptomyces bottropensis TaxID=42235 RepID=UPI003699593C